MRRAAAAGLTVMWLCTATIATAQEVCVGDCNGDDMVAINELIIGVNIALGLAQLSQCPSFDAGDDGQVGINELIAAVNNALEGCNGMPPDGTERVFTIAPGTLLEDPSTTGTGLFTTGLGGGNASNGPDDGFSSGPLTLVLGSQGEDGIGSLTLKEDVLLRIGIVDGSYLCFRLMAEGSEGSIDCDGDTAYDTRSTQAAGDVGFPFEVETGLGEPAGPGNGNLLVPVLYQIIATDNPEFGTPCDEVTYTNPVQVFPFTTTTTTSVKGNLELSVTGEPFDCANFGTPGSGGQLAAAAPARQAPIGDVSNVFRFAED